MSSSRAHTQTHTHFKVLMICEQIPVECREVIFYYAGEKRYQIPISHLPSILGKTLLRINFETLGPLDKRGINYRCSAEGNEVRGRRGGGWRMEEYQIEMLS